MGDGSTPVPRRCAWVTSDPLYIEYHDREWGVPVLNDERHLFEMLVLEGMQAGLSWLTVLRKREAFRAAFDDFDPVAVAAYGPEKLAALMANPAIIRNRAKIRAAVVNASAFLAIQRELGSFGDYIWRFVGGRPVNNRWATHGDVPVTTSAAAVLSRDLVRRGFRFVGPTICYSLMQAVGMVNDHTTGCFRHGEIAEMISRRFPSSSSDR